MHAALLSHAEASPQSDASGLVQTLERIRLALEASVVTLCISVEDGPKLHCHAGEATPAMTRATSFARHALHAMRPLVVADATLDRRFATNPLVTGKPFVRFYLGIPLLRACGDTMGVLSVFDSAPREPAAAIQLALLAKGITPVLANTLLGREN